MERILNTSVALVTAMFHADPTWFYVRSSCASADRRGHQSERWQPSLDRLPLVCTIRPRPSHTAACTCLERFHTNV